MVRRRGAEDWTPEVVARFWAYMAATQSKNARYFSEVYGAGIRRLLESTGRLRGRVLDFGCGPGFLSASLLEAEVACFGVDSSMEAVTRANRRCGGRRGWRGAFLASEARTPFRPSSFDVVCCVETMEHLDDHLLTAVLRELWRVLKPGGIALFTTPNAEDLGAALHYCPFCDSEFHPVQHLRSFTAETLSATLAASGYGVLFCRSIDLGRVDGSGLHNTDRRLMANLRLGLRRVVFETLGRLIRKDFPASYRFRALLSPGSNLCAIAQRMPSQHS